MKKLLCILTAVLLLASTSALAEGAAILNPNGYDLLLITDVFTNNDSETGEDVENLTIQGTFGTLAEPAAPEATDAATDDEALADEADYDAASELVGFSMEDIVSLSLAEGCEILLPQDPSDPTDPTAIDTIDDLQAWYDNANTVMADYFDEGQTSFAFYATFEMNDDGDLTKLAYQYFEWQ